MKDSEFSINLRVYIEDTDAGGIVFYVNYLKYMERARTELLRSLGFPKPALLTDELLLVVSSAAIEYKRPARLDDELRVTAVIERLGRSFIMFRQQVFKGDVCLCEANVKIACVTHCGTTTTTTKNLKATKIPTSIFNVFKSTLGDTT